MTVRQVLGGPYADREIVATSDGGWIYGYHQEGDDPSARDEEFTNRGLMENWRLQVPVIVLIQTKAKPGVRYLVQGLALVVGWDAGFFYLRGFGHRGSAPTAFGPTWERSLQAEAATLPESHHDAEILDPEHDSGYERWPPSFGARAKPRSGRGSSTRTEVAAP